MVFGGGRDMQQPFLWFWLRKPSLAFSTINRTVSEHYCVIFASIFIYHLVEFQFCLTFAPVSTQSGYDLAGTVPVSAAANPFCPLNVHAWHLTIVHVSDAVYCLRHPWLSSLCQTSFYIIQINRQIKNVCHLHAVLKMATNRAVCKTLTLGRSGYFKIEVNK